MIFAGHFRSEPGDGPLLLRSDLPRGRTEAEVVRFRCKGAQVRNLARVALEGALGSHQNGRFVTRTFEVFLGPRIGSFLGAGPS